MLKFFSLLGVLCCACCMWGATPKKSCVAINKINNQSSLNSEFFKSIMERLQNEIVNTGKFDVVDNSRLYEMATELKKQEDGLTDEDLDINLKVATISVHGTILSMIMETKEYKLYDQRYRKTVGTMELTIRFQDMRTGKISASKQVKISKTGLEQRSSINRDRSQKIKFTKIISPAKRVLNRETGRYEMIPAVTETAYLTPTESRILNEVMQGAVSAVVENLMEYAYPLYVIGASRGRVYINLPQERSQKKAQAGTKFEIFKLGEEMIDPDTGEVLGAEEEPMMVVVLQSIRPKLVIAVPVKGQEKFGELVAGMQEYRSALKAVRSTRAKALIKPPFQARVLTNFVPTKTPVSVPEKEENRAVDRFRR